MFCLCSKQQYRKIYRQDIYKMQK